MLKLLFHTPSNGDQPPLPLGPFKEPLRLVYGYIRAGCEPVARWDGDMWEVSICPGAIVGRYSDVDFISP